MTEFAVRGESQEGVIGTLRRGFPTFDAASAHPVSKARWKRIWVERLEDRPRPIDSPPPVPWEVVGLGDRLTYLRDAEGRCFMTLLGTQLRRAGTIGMLEDAGLIRSEPT